MSQEERYAKAISSSVYPRRFYSASNQRKRLDSVFKIPRGIELPLLLDLDLTSKLVKRSSIFSVSNNINQDHRIVELETHFLSEENQENRNSRNSAVTLLTCGVVIELQKPRAFTGKIRFFKVTIFFHRSKTSVILLA